MRSGDTLSKMLEKHHIAGGDINKIVSSLSKIWNPRYIRPGQDISLRFKKNDENEFGREFSSLEFKLELP